MNDHRAGDFLLGRENSGGAQADEWRDTAKSLALATLVPGGILAFRRRCGGATDKGWFGRRCGARRLNSRSISGGTGPDADRDANRQWRETANFL
jgi:hypothetical protein